MNIERAPLFIAVHITYRACLNRDYNNTHTWSEPIEGHINIFRVNHVEPCETKEGSRIYMDTLYLEVTETPEEIGRKLNGF